MNEFVTSRLITENTSENSLAINSNDEITSVTTEAIVPTREKIIYKITERIVDKNYGGK
jgi:hypothetical protein